MRFSTSFMGSKLHSWSLSIKDLSQSGKWQQVFSHFRETEQAGIQLTDTSVIPLILKACSNLSYIHGTSAHACLIKRGLELFTSVGNSIMDFYMKCRCLDSAVTMFDSMSSRDSVSWNIIVHGHLNLGALEKGLCWFNEARVSGFEPNNSTLVLVIRSCRRLESYCEGKQVHGYLIRSGFWVIISVQNSLLSMYVDSDMESARRLFDEMCERDVITWSAMIGGFVQSKETSSGLQLFRKMVSNVGIEPDGLTMVSVLKACADSRDLRMGRVVHGLVTCRGLDCDLFVGNSLIDMYSKCEDTGSAFKIFNEMSQKNNVSWNSMLSGYVLNEKYSEAISLVHSMGMEAIEVDEITLVNILQISKFIVLPMLCKSVHCVILRREYESNEFALNSLVDAYAKCYIVEVAWKLFNGMKIKDVVSWSTMIAGFAHCGMPDEAISVFRDMKQAEENPHTVTIINLLEACSVSAELSKSRWAHGIAIRGGLAGEVAVGTAIVDMYSKCGDIEASRKAFDQISKKNVVSWSAMVAAYGMNGLANEALALVDEMKLHGLKPNSVTTLSALSACSHGGLIQEGLSFFESMVQDHGIEPELEHYSCIVDMLSRAGKLETAMDLINKMPENVKAGASAWGAILSGCRIHHGNRELGWKAARRILELEPLNSAGYLLASTMYGTDGSWIEAAKMRLVAKRRGVKVIAGYSLVHVNNKAFKFLAGTQTQTQTQASDIDIVINQLHGCMKIDERNDLD
ncbi:hypothetical protein EZV62_012029 [Acer yangbiense]|uniref:Uncharacterized protein n=1 Tax=Acer yangbiense TaxID=1000413 RepID=A0A5C7I7A8_9ROSI|nr:hypothetical protein EZV62_012029 [Acer yangbiense]